MHSIDSQHHFSYVLRMGDNALILGQRLSEWCGHSPLIEEDIALANTALDHIGRARVLLSHAAQLEGRGRDEDSLAYLRDERLFGNFLICELPNGDFAFTLMRQFLLDVFHQYFFEGLVTSKDDVLASFAQKAVKEAHYHTKRSAGWVQRLGDGTPESHGRITSALEELWPYTPEFFAADVVDDFALEHGLAPSLTEIEAKWFPEVEELLEKATLKIPPADTWTASGGRSGEHTEHLGRMLAEMQVLQRQYPKQEW
ncbi:MAG: 1,2-phenylacetyl-CoA epoxidase subunit PaaC [Pseudomonadota bacterium]|nr:1,2-phenylacetyl-CoA epoxidase subunit PaaC [Pseudomonadota bacterium]